MIPAPEPLAGAITDAFMGDAFAYRYQGELRHLHDAHDWLRYDGARWRADDIGRAHTLAKQVIREAVNKALERDDRPLAEQVLRYHSAAKVAAMLKMAESVTGIPVTRDELDRDPWVLNVRNKTVDLRTGMAKDHEPADLLTKLCPVVYDPDAQCPLWLRFLAEIFDGHPERIAFLQRIFGYCLTGVIREQVLILFVGEGSNGKSTVLHVLHTLLGDYAKATDPAVFMERKGDPQGFNLAPLAGARAVTAIETNQGSRLNQALIKAMTGQDRIRAAFKNKDSFEFEPVWKAILATNHLPEIRGQGHAIWRRPKVLRFEVVIPDQRQDLDLWPKLDVEAAGVLNWALTGCYEWQRGGLQVPEDVVKATATYRDDQDELKDWITERCIVDPSRSDRFRTLFVDYVAWCKRAEQKPMGSKSFAQALNERQFVAKHTKHGDFRIGLAVQTSPQQGEIGESSVSDEASTKLGETSQGHFSGFRESPHAHARKPENNGHQVSPLTEEPEFDHAAERWHVAGRPIDETAWLERAEVKYLVEVTR